MTNQRQGPVLVTGSKRCNVDADADVGVDTAVHSWIGG